MFAHLIGYTDTTPYEVVRKISEKTLEVRRMDSETDQPVFRIRQHKSGQWKDRDGFYFSLHPEPQ